MSLQVPNLESEKNFIVVFIYFFFNSPDTVLLNCSHQLQNQEDFLLLRSPQSIQLVALLTSFTYFASVPSKLGEQNFKSASNQSLDLSYRAI